MLLKVTNALMQVADISDFTVSKFNSISFQIFLLFVPKIPTRLTSYIV